MIKPLEELTDAQLAAITAQCHTNTLNHLEALRELRIAAALLHTETVRRLQRTMEVPGEVDALLRRAGAGAAE